MFLAKKNYIRNISKIISARPEAEFAVKALPKMISKLFFELIKSDFEIISELYHKLFQRDLRPSLL